MVSNKVLVEIKLPPSGKSFDVYIPLDCKMHVVNRLVATSLSDLSEGSYKYDENSVLCDAKTGSIFNSDVYVNELGIKNGDKLILM